MNHTIEQDILTFCRRFQNEPWFEVLFWGGSSRFRPVTENTDVDLFIIANDSLPKRIHGLHRFNGTMMEYFVNPLSRIETQMQNEIAWIHDYWVIKIYAFAKILLDKNGQAAKLQALANQRFQQPFSPNDPDTELSNYSRVWDCYTDYLELCRLGYNAEPMYYETLKAILHAYCYQHQTPLIPWNKCQQLLQDVAYRTNYHLKCLPDQDFCAVFSRCLEAPPADRALLLGELYDTVLKQSGFSPEDYTQTKS